MWLQLTLLIFHKQHMLGEGGTDATPLLGQITGISFPWLHVWRLQSLFAFAQHSSGYMSVAVAEYWHGWDQAWKWRLHGLSVRSSLKQAICGVQVAAEMQPKVVFWLGSGCWCRGRVWHLKALPVIIDQGWRPWLYLLVWAPAKPSLAPAKGLFSASSSTVSLAALLGEDKGSPVTLCAEFYQSGAEISSSAGCDLLFSPSYIWNTLQIFWPVPTFLEMMCLLCFVHLECWRLGRFIFLTLLPFFLQPRHHTVFPLVHRQNISFS